nr:ACP S-malonyltransferase [Rhodococcus sp. (in: high G+C Gram-positive bacteria)]
MFPGQGSQTPDLESKVRAWAPDLARHAVDALGDDVFRSVDTRLLQPAIYCAGIAGWRRSKKADVGDPAAIVGHSLGELAALAAAGVISHADGLDLVITRGQLMWDAAQRLPGGGMMAILGCDGEQVYALARRLGLTVATDNAPGEVVLAGRSDTLNEAANQLADSGAKAVVLPIEGAFHSPEMDIVRAEFEDAVRSVPWSSPSCPVYSSHTGFEFDDIATGLGASLVGSVQWRTTLLRLQSSGFHSFVDCGPGHVLAKLVRRTLGRNAIALDDLNDDELTDTEPGASTRTPRKVGASS